VDQDFRSRSSRAVSATRLTSSKTRRSKRALPPPEPSASLNEQHRWSAIARGAVMSAAKGLLDGEFAEVTSRICRANYGFIYETKFVDGKHNERDKYYSFVEGCHKARNQLWWFLKKASKPLTGSSCHGAHLTASQGEKSSQNEPFRVEYTRVYEPSDHFDYPDLSGEIWTCAGHNPPTRVQDGVTQLCEMKFTAPVPFDDLPEETNYQGNPIKVFEYAYEILTYGDSVDVNIFASGQRLTGKNLDIDYELERRQANFRSDSRAQTRPDAAAGSSSSAAAAGNPGSSTGASTSAAPTPLPSTPESEADLYDDGPGELPPPSYTPYSTNPFADPPTSPSVASVSTVGPASIPTPPPMPPSFAGRPAFQPPLGPAAVPPAREYIPYRPPGATLRAPTGPPAFSSLTPVLAPTATPLVNVPLPPHRIRASNSSDSSLPLRQTNTGSTNPFSPGFQTTSPLGPQFRTGPPPPPPGSNIRPQGFGPGLGPRGPGPASPPSPPGPGGDRESDDFVVLNRRGSVNSVRTANSASGASQRSKRRVKPLSSFLRRRREDDSDSD